MRFIIVFPITVLAGSAVAIPVLTGIPTCGNGLMCNLPFDPLTNAPAILGHKGAIEHGKQELPKGDTDKPESGAPKEGKSSGGQHGQGSKGHGGHQHGGSE